MLWTAPAGNVYYILAHAYAAAALNGLDGASTASVDDELDAAEDILDDLTPAAAAVLTGGSALRRQMLCPAGILDDHNNGLVGPEHCD